MHKISIVLAILAILSILTGCNFTAPRGENLLIDGIPMVIDKTYLLPEERNIGLVFQD